MNGRALALVFAGALAGCSPKPPPKTEAPAAATAPPVSWEARFRAAHGGGFDPASALDREKMAALKGVPAAAVAPVLKKPLPARERVLAIARPLVGGMETQGANRSPLIDAMNRLAGVPMGSPYCASFNAWCYAEGGAPPGWPRSAWSPDWVQAPTWTSAKGGRTPQPADAFGIWFSSKGRVAHTGLIERWEGASAITIEGNTSPSAEFGAAGDRDGDGIWRKRRLKNQIYAVRDWLGAAP